MKNPFEAFFRPEQGRAPEMGGAATKLGSILSGADPDGKGSLVMTHGMHNLYRDEQSVPVEDTGRIDALKAAEKDGVVWDATTATMQRVGVDGLPVEMRK